MASVQASPIPTSHLRRFRQPGKFKAIFPSKYQYRFIFAERANPCSEMWDAAQI